MTQIVLNNDFNVDEITEDICNELSKWKTHKITLNNVLWKIFDHDGEIFKSYLFDIHFDNIEVRIKMEDLRLNIIHYVESLKDDTTYEYNVI